MTLAIAATLLAGLATLGACSRRTAQANDPYAPYRPAVKSEFQSDFDRLDGAPRYALDVTLDPSGDLLTGTAEVLVTNTSPDPWKFLVFRLYPALSQYGGEMRILSVLVDAQPATFVYEADNTAIRLDLPASLPAGRNLTAKLTWRLTIPRWSDNPALYALFGHSQQMLSLPLFYPALAIYQPGPTLGSGHWWQEMGSVRGDAAFNLTSLFVVTATLPSEQVPVASGTLVGSQVLSDSRFTRHVWVAGPVREFVLHMSPVFSSASLEAFGTRVVSYWLPGHEAAGRAALQYAVAALRAYSDYFGEYPFRDMRVAPAPLTYRGMEYPQVTLLGVELYDRFRSNLEILVAHEVAHQWWYQIVHNDPIAYPWLDEAIAEYSVKLYYEMLHGVRSADLLARQRWQTPVNLLAERSGDLPIGQPVDSYETGAQYETVVYAKGALFYGRLREVLGDRGFRRLLRDYLERHRYQIVDPASWQAMLDELHHPELDALYQEWVAPLPTPAVRETLLER
ncbi:MAG TPA: M1 family metallopeptidase [Caldilineaceae bacterium]|nr:M1 family metallopeptidase [Caldilineaceae bacterium]